MSLTNKVAQFDADSDLVNAWVHGPASGVGSTVTTESGTVRTPAKLIADNEAELQAVIDLTSGWANGNTTTTAVLGGMPVPSPAKLIADKAAEINVDAAGVLALSTAQASTATTKASDATTQAMLATAAKVAAELARDVSLVQAGVYVDEPTGRAAVADGMAFKVQGSGDIAAYEYRRTNSTTSVLITTYPSIAALANPRVTSLADVSKNRITLPAGGIFLGTAGDTTGAFKIKLPAGLSPTNVVLNVTIMDNYGFLKLEISGFNNVGAWNYTQASVNGVHAYQPKPNVRWGNDGTSDCIWISDLAVNFWAYPQVWIDSVFVGGSGGEQWTSDWNISLVTAFDTVTAGPKSPGGTQNVRADSIADFTRNRVIMPAGGVFNGGGGDTTGALKIKFPVGIGAANNVLNITIADNYGVMHLMVAGFNNTGSWDYTKATIESEHQFQPQPSIRWGKDGTSDCVWISDLEVNYWAYPKVWINSVLVGNGATEAWTTGWAISLVTAFDTVLAGPTTPTKGMSSNNPTFTGTLNGGNVNFPFAAGGTHLGYQSGPVMPVNGTYNTTVGYQAGAAMTTGYNNAFGGLQTGAACTTGYGNSGWGLQVLQLLSTGSFNSGFGIHALLALTTGIANTAVGGGCMEFASTGGSNTAVGMYAGRDVGAGSNNVFIGNRAGQMGGDNPVGAPVGTISGCVCIGNEAGKGNTVGDKLFIANNATTPLVEGDFANNRLWVGGGADDGINTHQINGPIRFKPAAISTPVNNGDLTFEATSDTSLKVKFKGSDGVVRSVTLALAL